FAGNLFVLCVPHGTLRGNGNRDCARNGDSLSADPLAGAVCEQAIRIGGARAMCGGVCVAAPSHAAAAPQSSRLRCLLSRTVHEPLPLRMGTRGGEVPLYGTLS